MLNINLGSDTSDSIRKYLRKTQDSKDRQEEFDMFLEMISPSLKHRVQNHVLKNQLLKNKIICQALKVELKQNITSIIS